MSKYLNHSIFIPLRAPLTADLGAHDMEKDSFSRYINLKTYFTQIRAGVEIVAELRLEGRTIQTLQADVDNDSRILSNFPSLPPMDGWLSWWALWEMQKKALKSYFVSALKPKIDNTLLSIPSGLWWNAQFCLW